MAPWLSAKLQRLVLFCSYEMSSKQISENLQLWADSLGAMLQCWYNEQIDSVPIQRMKEYCNWRKTLIRNFFSKYRTRHNGSTWPKLARKLLFVAIITKFEKKKLHSSRPLINGHYSNNVLIITIPYCHNLMIIIMIIKNLPRFRMISSLELR